MTPADIHVTLDSALGTFLALMFLEGLVKPLARTLTRTIFKKLDSQIHILPDWLYDPDRNG